MQRSLGSLEMFEGGTYDDGCLVVAARKNQEHVKAERTGASKARATWVAGENVGMQGPTCPLQTYSVTVLLLRISITVSFYSDPSRMVCT